LQTERSEASEFAKYAFTIDKQKTLRAGIEDQKGRRGAKAIAPEADFACFLA